MEKKEILDIIQEHISRFYTTSPPKYRDRKNLTAHFENCINEVLEQELDKAREEGYRKGWEEGYEECKQVNKELSKLKDNK
ncbi:MAG: hypothetical protein BWY21_01902 [Parcubacteria group bacterium ADurb.Bin216]|nr:MAG: hypothetical protein BWY21_01902 [Parcubacteria group bacterium ADurb.Bin216]